MARLAGDTGDPVLEIALGPLSSWLAMAVLREDG